MNSFPNAPLVTQGSIWQIDLKSGLPIDKIYFQYNPESLTRAFSLPGAEGNTSPQNKRLPRPASESITLEAELDAIDYLEKPELHQGVVEYGIQPQLAALQALINPSWEELNTTNLLAAAGSLQIIAPEQPLSLFVWGKQQIVPIKITTLGIEEQAFDQQLNPIRAKVNLTMKVLDVTDVGFTHRAGSLFMSYLKQREKIAAKRSTIL